MLKRGKDLKIKESLTVLNIFEIGKRAMAIKNMY